MVQSADMITGLRPYAAYKPSGIEWLGDVPEHWEIRSIKTILREKDLQSHDGREPLLSLTREQGIVAHSEFSKRPAGASDRTKYKLCNPGDLVMNRMQAWSGMFAISSLYGLISPDYSIFSPLRPQDVCIGFFESLFKTPTFVQQFAKRSKGIGSGFNRLYTPDFGSLPCVVPTSNEQTAIVRFLDQATGRIKRCIRAKEKLIALLEEQKRINVHDAVFGRINVHTGKPYSAYEDSGIEWLGAVPAHWEIRRTKKPF